MFFLIFRFASYYRDTLDIKAHDVVHIMIGGNNFAIPFAVLGALAIGAVPAFGELWLPEDTLTVQVTGWVSMTLGVNFTNILRAAFTYVSCARSFFVLTS